MTSSYSNYELVARGIYKNLNRSCKAFLKQIFWYCTLPGGKQRCFLTLPEIGRDLKSWGHNKNVGRTQSKKLFKMLRSHSIFDLERVTNRSRYNIKLNEIGLELGRLCHSGHVDKYEKVTPYYEKSDPLPYEKVTPSLEKSDPLISDLKNKKNKIEIRSCGSVDNSALREEGFFVFDAGEAVDRKAMENYLSRLRRKNDLYEQTKRCNYTNTSSSDDVRVQDGFITSPPVNDWEKSSYDDLTREDKVAMKSKFMGSINESLGRI